ncbi:MAG: TRAP transporter substrate-binding protein [Candidatus Velthaea sp.]
MSKRVSRREFALTATALASITILPSRVYAAPQFSLKLGTDNAPQNPTNVRAKEIFAEVLQQSGGRLQITDYPNNQLGGASQMLAQVRAGALEFMMADGGVLGSVIPIAAMFGVGFAFNDSAQAFRAFDGDLGAYIRKEINAKGLWVHDQAFLNGMRQVTSSGKPIQSVADLQGFKIRTPNAKLATDLFGTLGAAPTPMNFNEVYTSLQTKVVDGQENPLTVIETSRLYEVQKYLSMTNHMWSGFWLIGNNDAWSRLPPDLQQTAIAGFRKYAREQRADVETMNDNLAQTLQKHGLAINKVDPAPFRAKLSPFYARWKNEFGDKAWAMLENDTGKLR